MILGREARKQQFQRRFSIDLVKCAVEATCELLEELYPEKEPELNTEVNQFKFQISKL